MSNAMLVWKVRLSLAAVATVMAAVHARNVPSSQVDATQVADSQSYARRVGGIRASSRRRGTCAVRQKIAGAPDVDSRESSVPRTI